MLIQPLSKPFFFNWNYGFTVVPDTPTTVVAETTVLLKMWLSNVTASPVTVLVTDLSTEAGGSPCQIWPSVSLDPNSVVVVDLDGVFANGGVAWSASVADSVHGFLSGGGGAYKTGDVA